MDLDPTLLIQVTQHFFGAMHKKTIPNKSDLASYVLLELLDESARRPGPLKVWTHL